MPARFRPTSGLFHDDDRHQGQREERQAKEKKMSRLEMEATLKVREEMACQKCAYANEEGARVFP